jgi:hypothetical protein
VTAPTKPKKTARNQTPKFDEALGGLLPTVSTELEAPRYLVGPLNPRTVFAVIWAAAAILAGIGIGLSLKTATYSTSSFEAPAPIANANVIVTGLSDQLETHTAADINNLQVTTNVSTVQPADLADSIHPVWSQYLTLQGNIGTAAIK